MLLAKSTTVTSTSPHRASSDGCQLESSFRPRRSHEKSRKGCLRCKQQRKKCDEKRPSCSRCFKCLHSCQYETPRQPSPHVEEREAYLRPLPRLFLHMPSPISADTSPDTAVSGHYYSPLDWPSPSPPYMSSVSESDDFSAITSSLPELLDATELGLLSHYLSHTARSVAYDEDDLYALSVGIPNLAIRSRSVMSSMLALSAVRKTHEIIQSSATPLDKLHEIRDLLALADRHHRASLQQIRAAIPLASNYDSVLANATLMVLYCSASHCVRVQLLQSAKASDTLLPVDVLPLQSQWIVLIRAADTAYSALLSDDANEAALEGLRLSTELDDREDESRCAYDSGQVIAPEDGPSDETRQLLLPIVGNTYASALTSLRNRVDDVVFRDGHHPGTHISELNACLAALADLDRAATAVFADLSPTKTESESVRGGMQHCASSQGYRVSSWLRRYISRVTSNTTPIPLRRIVMSFLNRVPKEYLDMIQSMLDEAPRGGEAVTATQRLAMDIFAHWLVLVMLLDGVWWIGGIGAWELGRVISLMKATDSTVSKSKSGDGGGMASRADKWWPESMLLVQSELSQHLRTRK